MTTADKRRARALQNKGKTLHEIAAALGASYADVVLALYGGAPEEAVAASAVRRPARSKGGASESKSPAVPIGGEQSGLGASAKVATAPDGGATDETPSPHLPEMATRTGPPVETQEAQDAQEGPQRASECPTTGSASPLRRSSGVRAAPPCSPQANTRKVAPGGHKTGGARPASPVANSGSALLAEFSTRYRLRRADGRYLEKSGLTVTDDVRRAWSGNARQLEAVRRSSIALTRDMEAVKA